MTDREIFDALSQLIARTDLARVLNELVSVVDAMGDEYMEVSDSLYAALKEARIVQRRFEI